mgnify:CR=1 FL=1
MMSGWVFGTVALRNIIPQTQYLLAKPYRGQFSQNCPALVAGERRGSASLRENSTKLDVETTLINCKMLP